MLFFCMVKGAFTTKEKRLFQPLTAAKKVGIGRYDSKLDVEFRNDPKHNIKSKSVNVTEVLA